MAKNYEAICESLRLAGEQKLVKLSNTFQEHQQWLKQAFEVARAQLAAQKEVPQNAKPGKGRGASDKVCPAERTPTKAMKTFHTVLSATEASRNPVLEPGLTLSLAEWTHMLIQSITNLKALRHLSALYARASLCYLQALNACACAGKHTCTKAQQQEARRSCSCAGRHHRRRADRRGHRIQA